MNKPNLPILFVLLFASCELVIDVEQPDFDPRLVVQTHVSNSESPLLFLSQDYYILDRSLDNYNDGNGINGATISVFEDDQLLGTMEPFSIGGNFDGSSFEGFYSLDYQPELGRTYRFEVEKDGFTRAIGETTVPTETLTYEVGEITESVNEWGGTEYRIEVEINDPPGDNYYEVEAVLYTYDPVFDEFGEVTQFNPISYRAYLYSENIVIPEYQYDRLLFTDDIFDGNTYTFTATGDFYLETYLREEYGLTEDSYVLLKIRSCSEEYYNYYNTAALQNWNSGDPLVEPVPIYTNVQNGFGIVGSYYEEVDTLFVY